MGNLESGVGVIHIGGVEVVAMEFFTHGEAGDAEPTGGLGLIAVGFFDYGGKQFAFELVDEVSVSGLSFSAGGPGEGIFDEFFEAERLAGFFSRGGGIGFGEDVAEMFPVDCITS